MKFKKPEKEEDLKFEERPLIPEGTHTMVCMMAQPKVVKFGSENVQGLTVMWEPQNGKFANVFDNIAAVEKLFWKVRMLSEASGVPLSEDGEFDEKKLLGKSVLVKIVHNKGANDKTYANVKSYSKDDSKKQPKKKQQDAAADSIPF